MKLPLYYQAELVKAAQEGMHYARTVHQDDPRFGTAVLTDKGNIYSAGHYISDSLSLTLHAEQVAIAHAAAHGEYAIVALATVGNEAAYKMSGGIIYPCHICKQVLWESHLRSGHNTEIYIVDCSLKIVEKLLLREIMHSPWPLPR